MSKLKTFSTLCAASALALAAGVAHAATMNVTNISGVWLETTPDGSPYNGISGAGTDTITWGSPATHNGKKSGYTFDAASVPFGANPDDTFALGTFTHENWPITGTSITEAVLEVTFNFLLGDETTERQLTSSFVFDHWETPNEQTQGFWLWATKVCVEGDGGTWGKGGVNANGCADRVMADGNEAVSTTFEIDGATYTLDVAGFMVGDQQMDEFWTKEEASNSATLMGKFTYVAPEVAPVPLPAAGWLLLGGIGALGVARRRQAGRKAA